MSGKPEPMKALAVYYRLGLGRTPRGKLSEVDVRTLEQAEVVLRDVPSLEIIDLIRRSPIALPRL
jgi:hypothetical protein